jgi:hypothetical protein
MGGSLQSEGNENLDRVCWVWLLIDERWFPK